MSRLTELADALDDIADHGSNLFAEERLQANEAAALLRAAAGADVHGLMEMVDDHGKYRWASGFDEARRHTVTAMMNDNYAVQSRATIETAFRLALPVWRPIEEAPKDAGRVLLAAEGKTCYGHWYDSYQRWEYDGYSFGNPKSQPTEWMPLPLPPQPKGRT